MGCDDYREALSAQLDAEDPPGGPTAVDAHLAGCAECRRWLDDAAAVNRLVRTGSLIRTGTAVASVDVTEAVLPSAPGRWRGRVVLALRVVLGGFGVAQLVLGLLQVTALRTAESSDLHGTTIDGAAPGHLWHESAAWNIAVGAAFLWVATRRGRPVGIVPILTVFIAALVLLSTADLLAGEVAVARLTSHGFVLVGYLVVLALARTQLDFAGPGQAGQRRTGRVVAAPLPDNVRPLPHRGQPAAQVRHQEAA